jgi:hypothetical protein
VVLIAAAVLWALGADVSVRPLEPFPHGALRVTGHALKSAGAVAMLRDAGYMRHGACDWYVIF